VTTVPEFMEKVWAYVDRDGHSLGGALHIAVDDGNIDDSHIEFCRQFALEQGDVEGAWLATLLAEMSKTQRRKVAWRFYRR
jgi:hypothetical protein